MARMLILVEGQTEERFVKDVLVPEYSPRGLDITPVILTTKKVKDGPNFKGGVSSFAKFNKDLLPLLNSGGAWVTTLLDYYALPDDFPGMATRPAGASPRDRVLHVEMEMRRHFALPKKFFPFLALHEFEAWLFSDSEALPNTMSAPECVQKMTSIIDEFESPEHINDRPELAPSKRVLSMFPGYRKRLHGPTVVQRIGLVAVRRACPHFSAWLDRLDGIAVAGV